MSGLGACVLLAIGESKPCPENVAELPPQWPVPSVRARGAKMTAVRPRGPRREDDRRPDWLDIQMRAGLRPVYARRLGWRWSPSGELSCDYICAAEKKNKMHPICCAMGCALGRRE